jgi:WD40 repeat protein
MALDDENGRVLLGSLFGSCHVWNPDHPSGYMTTDTSNEKILDIALVPDGQCAIAAGCDDTITTWELDTGQIRMHMKGAIGKVDAVAIAPNGESLTRSTTIH